jgi:hypothetical protein
VIDTIDMNLHEFNPAVIGFRRGGTILCVNWVLLVCLGSPYACGSSFDFLVVCIHKEVLYFFISHFYRATNIEFLTTRDRHTIVVYFFIVANLKPRTLIQGL